MVTEISGAGVSHSVASQTGTTAAQRSVGTVRPDDAGLPQPEVSRDKQSATSVQVAGAYAQLRVRQDALNKAASVVREVSDTVGQAGQLLGKVEKNLGEIVKMYPPYPIDNPQRISLLNEISGLRKEIEGLTFPPAAAVDAVGHLFANQTDTTAKGDATTAKPDASLAAVKDQPWDLPKLDPRTASDAEVSKALDQVKTRMSSLEDLQTRLWKDVDNFVKQAKSPEAQSQAVGIRDRLADLGNLGIGSNARQLDQAVESK
ncbi:MAG: hypothetical protein PHD37_11715 [Gallionellaceae bacterium]|nr:hypothetical protein [Gallionellaceae bacterium]